MLNISNLQASIEGKEILKGVDLKVRRGEVHVIMGPNGSGKSTLANVLMGHPGYKVGKSNKKPSMTLDGKDLAGMTPDKRAKAGLLLAFQYPVSVEGVTPEQLLRKVARWGKFKSKGKISVLEFRRYLKGEARKLGIKPQLLTRSLNDGFSGGEKKRIEILQLKVLKPKYAVLDETDSGLDIDALKVVARGIREIAKTCGVILITHYQRILKFVRPDFVHVMIEGKIVKNGEGRLARELEREGYRKYE